MNQLASFLLVIALTIPFWLLGDAPLLAPVILILFFIAGSRVC